MLTNYLFKKKKKKERNYPLERQRSFKIENEIEETKQFQNKKHK